MSALREITQRKRADGNAEKAENVDAKCIEHTADLAVFAFIEDDFEPGMLFTGAQEDGALGFKDLAVRHFDATLERFEETTVSDDVDLHVISLVEKRGGIGNAGGPLGVVGEKHKPLAGLVEAADRSDPFEVWRQEGIDGMAAFFIGGAGDNAAGLVEDKIEFFGRRDGSTIYQDAVLAKPHRGFGIFDDGAVKADLACPNQSSGLRTGAQAEFRNGAGEADAFGVMFVSGGSAESIHEI